MDEKQSLLSVQYTFEELPAVVDRLLDNGLVGAEVVLLRGDLGAGKTTLIKYLVAALGLKDEVTSPTFSLVQEYGGGGENLVYHLDLYRIESQEEALDIGIEEYLYGHLCFIEWPDIIEELLPESYYLLELENLGKFERLIHFSKITTRLHE